MVVVVVELLVVVLVVVLVAGHGFGSQVPSPMGTPPLAKQPGGFNRKQELATQHRSIIVVEVEVVEVVVVEPVVVLVVELVVVELVVVEVVVVKWSVVVVVELTVVDEVVELVVVDVVVELVVVVVTGQSGSPGCPVQVHCPALHWARIDDLQALRAAPDKPAHPAAISSEHAFEPQIGDAALAPETKTPAPSATAANVTTALRVIVEPPFGRSNPKIDFRRSTAACSLFDTLVKGKSPAGMPAMTTPRAAGERGERLDRLDDAGPGRRPVARHLDGAVELAEEPRECDGAAAVIAARTCRA